MLDEDDVKSNVEDGGNFPQIVKLWAGGEFKFLGSGIKYRKIVFVSIQVSIFALLRPTTRYSLFM